ncbi:molecular chaperone DnaJ [Salmonella enterica subsp. diarizonae]|nr:molecular chaperone DnaJ [Salmonella enterica subsp. diarizonae]
MTTITKEHAQKIIDAADEVITALAGTNDDFHPDNSEKMCGLWDDLNDRYAPPEVVRELARAMLASMDAEPAGYHVIKECGKVGCSVATLEEAEKTRDFWNKKWTIRPYFYSAPPVQETGVYKDMLNIIGLLENNEWAEHCTSTVLGSLLESEITRLVGKGQPAPVVPDECPDELLAFCEQVIDSRITANAKADGLWNACRAAMLQGSQPVSNCDELQVIGWLRSDYNSDDKRDPNAPLFMLGRNDPSEAWGVKYIPLSGNSPVIPGVYLADINTDHQH